MRGEDSHWRAVFDAASQRVEVQRRSSSMTTVDVTAFETPQKEVGKQQTLQARDALKRKTAVIDARMRRVKTFCCV